MRSDLYADDEIAVPQLSTTIMWSIPCRQVSFFTQKYVVNVIKYHVISKIMWSIMSSSISSTQKYVVM